MGKAVRVFSVALKKTERHIKIGKFPKKNTGAVIFYLLVSK